ncbi:SDR family NAD(P)-dependent oxidoreductase [Ancylobacter terrae]|uniref:SDR family NAD(P)-dependent oxidoreductase n=1 Tax=Ancylobacter sp. sgz301288 TaxID=3342077 RepID=UPI003859340E
MTSTSLLEGKLALVTGAANGNGAAIARGLAEHGARVLLSDIDADAVEARVRTLRAEGLDCVGLMLDVSCSLECERVAAATAADFGDLDILVNNAGIRPRHAFESADRNLHWQQAIRVNLDGIRNTTLAWLAGLRRTRGAVINITSIAAYNASPGSIAYSTSKAAAQMLSKALACELAADGIRVNSIAPGVIETEMTRPSREEPGRRNRLLARIPMARFGKPEELVGAVVFLGSDLSTYVTGSTIAVDGGYLAN